MDPTPKRVWPKRRSAACTVRYLMSADVPYKVRIRYVTCGGDEEPPLRYLDGVCTPSRANQRKGGASSRVGKIYAKTEGSELTIGSVNSASSRIHGLNLRRFGPA